VLIPDKIDDSVIYLMSYKLINTEVIYIYNDSIDISVKNAIKRQNVETFCTVEGCKCDKKIDLDVLMDLFFCDNIIYDKRIKNLKVSKVYQSSFGVYVREMMSIWIEKTGYTDYVVLGAEASDVLAYSKLIISKNIKFVGMPEYNEEEVRIKSNLVVSVIDNNKKNNLTLNMLGNRINDKIKSMSNRLLDIYDFIDCKLDFDDVKTIDDVENNIIAYFNDKCTIICDSEIIKGGVAKNRCLLIILNELNLSDVLDMIKGYANYYVISKNNLNSKIKFKSVIKCEDFILYKLFVGYYADDLSEVSIRNVIQRKFIRNGNYFNKNTPLCSNSGVNIATFTLSNISNVNRFKSKFPLSRIIAVVPDYNMYKSINNNISYKHRHPSMEFVEGDKTYSDFLFSSKMACSYGLDYISMKDFEVLCLSDSNNDYYNAFLHPTDYRKLFWGVITDFSSNINIQFSLNSDTLYLKSLTYILKSRLKVDDSYLHNQRYAYMLKDDHKLKFKVKGMWCVAYYYDKLNDKINFYDYSGHLSNFLLMSEISITNMSGYIRCVQQNCLDYPDVNFMYYGINVESIYYSSKYSNLESRDQMSLKEDLWHTKKEFRLAMFNSNVLCRIILNREYIKDLPVNFVNSINNLQYKEGRDKSMTVRHDENDKGVSEIIKNENYANDDLVDL